MLKYVIMIVLFAMLAISSNPVATMAAGGAGAGIPGVSQGNSLLAKTWTTGVQKKEAGSQVLATASVTSRGSFEAEGKGFEPSTGCRAPGFETGCRKHWGDGTCVLAPYRRRVRLDAATFPAGPHLIQTITHCP
jgi:hypothetical protein